MAGLTTAAAAKLAAAILTNEKSRKAVAWIITAILSPLIMIFILIFAFMSGGSEHNIAAVDLCYYGGTISGTVPEAYRQYIEEMRNSFADIDSNIATVSAMTENGNGLDSHRVKAVFYALYFGCENPCATPISQFVDCFVTYDQRADTWTDEEGVAHETTYTVAVPVASLETVYKNIVAAMGVEITDAVRENADSIYSRTRSGGAVFSGEYERGGGASLELDISSFVDLTAKNNQDLVVYAVHAWESGWGYVWGTFGNVLTEALYESKLAQYPEGVGNYADFIQENWLGGRTTDCVGLIKGYGWLNPGTLTIDYATNGMPDIGANQMYQYAEVKGDISSMPDTPGLAIWHDGHIGIYIGNGEVIEAMGTKYGVVKTQLADRGWTAWLEIPYITYITEE